MQLDINMQVLMLMLLALGASSQHVYYVKPNNSSSCPGQPCLTLDQYASQGTRYFATGTTFLFLAGNHSGNRTVFLESISDVIFRGIETNSDVTVLKAYISCNNVTNFTIQGMVFVPRTADIPDGLFVTILDSKEILFLNTTFQVPSALKNARVRAVYCMNSDVIIINCLFEGNRAHDGAAISLSVT